MIDIPLDATAIEVVAALEKWAVDTKLAVTTAHEEFAHGDPGAFPAAREQYARRVWEQGRLWNILAALRGPDSEDLKEVKTDTTAVLREAVLPTLATHAGVEHRPDLAGDPAELKRLLNRHEVFGRARAGGLHFAYHLQWAVEALGIQPTDFWNHR